MTTMTTNTDVAMPELPEPAAAQSRFIATDQEWLPCNVAHSRMVLAEPTAWAGYEARYLYTAEQVRTAIQQAAGAVPEGWRLVPDEPTLKMLHAGWDVDELVTPDKTYRAMLGAAPQLRSEKISVLSASPAPPKQQPVHLGGVPLTTAELMGIHSAHATANANGGLARHDFARAIEAAAQTKGPT